MAINNIHTSSLSPWLWLEHSVEMSAKLFSLVRWGKLISQFIVTSIFYFACGRAVIIQISNEHAWYHIEVPLWSWESSTWSHDIGAKRAADVTCIYFMSLINCPFQQIAHNKNSLGDTILYLLSFRDLRRSCIKRVARPGPPSPRITELCSSCVAGDTSCSTTTTWHRIWLHYTWTMPSIEGVWSMGGDLEIWNF